MKMRHGLLGIGIGVALSVPLTGCATGADRQGRAATYLAPSGSLPIRVGRHRDAALDQGESQTDTSTWKVFTPVEGPLGGPFDMSALLDPPAGRHGFLTVRDGHFAFEDGTPVRFFGVNVQGAHALPSHEEAERLAQRLAQLGCNIVRLHHLDAPWATPNIFDPAFDDTQHLSAESLDRLGYFIAQLKARGIYVYLDLLVDRKFRAGDGVPASEELRKGAEFVCEYNPRLIELQKQYARDLLTYANPYTNTRLVDEPAIALVDIVNESSLFWLHQRVQQVPPVYLEELKQLWVRYLADHGVPHPEAHGDRFLRHRDPQVQDFYADVQLRYFQEMYAHLRSVGLKSPIAGSNRTRPGLDRDLLTNAQLDFIDRHAYWDHPKGGYRDDAVFHNRLMIEAGDNSNPIVRLSRERVQGKPFVVSEWNVAWPNEYRAVGPLLMAAYASFQDWDGLIQFRYDGELAPSRIDNHFDVSTKPELFLQFPSAARLFHRRDVAPSRERQAYPILLTSKIPPALAFLHGIDRLLDGSPTPRPVDRRPPWISDTEELGWDARQGMVLIETSRTQAAIGRVGGTPIELRDVAFEVATPFACLIVTSVDDRPLEQSRHLLVTTVARAENSRMVYNGTRTQLRDSGTTPIVMEPVVGSASLPLNGRGIPTVFVLDAAGGRVSEIAVASQEQRVDVPLAEGHVYEVVFEG